MSQSGTNVSTNNSDLIVNGSGSSTTSSGTGGSFCCSPPPLRTEINNVEENYTEYKFLLPNVTKDQVDVKVKEGYEENSSIVKVNVDEEAVEDNEFVNYFNKKLQFDSLYDIDTLSVSFKDSVLTIKVEKRKEEQYRHVDLD